MYLWFAESYDLVMQVHDVRSAWAPQSRVKEHLTTTVPIMWSSSVTVYNRYIDDKRYYLGTQYWVPSYIMYVYMLREPGVCLAVLTKNSPLWQWLTPSLLLHMAHALLNTCHINTLHQRCHPGFKSFKIHAHSYMSARLVHIAKKHLTVARKRWHKLRNSCPNMG